VGQHSAGERPIKGEKTEGRVLEGFMLYLEAAGIRSARRYIMSVNSFLGFCAQAGFGFQSVRPADADSYRAHLLELGKSRATVNNDLNRLRRFYRWAWKRHMVIEDPFLSLHSLPTGRSLPKTILSVDEMGLFLERFAIRSENDIMMKSLVELLYGSALRISEAEALRLQDVDFDAGVLLINERKTGVSRKVPASGASLKSLKTYIAHAWFSCVSERDHAQGFLFPRKGETTLRGLLNAKLARECGRLSLKRITTHSFRHAAATHMLRSGAGIRSVQALLGHKRIGCTQRYTHVVTEDLKEVLASFHPREALR
jgi:site-specific recombinase XerD